MGVLPISCMRWHDLHQARKAQAAHRLHPCTTAASLHPGGTPAPAAFLPPPGPPWRSSARSRRTCGRLKAKQGQARQYNMSGRVSRVSTRRPRKHQQRGGQAVAGRQAGRRAAQRGGATHCFISRPSRAPASDSKYCGSTRVGNSERAASSAATRQKRECGATPSTELQMRRPQAQLLLPPTWS